MCIVLYSPKNGMRVHSIMANHTEHLNALTDLEPIELSPIGVDTGQIGIFDASKYPDDNTIQNFDKNWKNPESFYRRVSDITIKSHFGTVEEGFVCSAGFGDGLYNAFKYELNGVGVGIMALFMDESDVAYMKKEFEKGKK